MKFLERDYNYFMSKCDNVEAEIKVPGNKKDYINVQKMYISPKFRWTLFLELDNIEAIEVKLLKAKSETLYNEVLINP